MGSNSATNITKHHDNEKDRNLSVQPVKKEESNPSHYLTRLWSGILIFIGVLGAIVTIPLSFLGGIFGLLAGFFTRTELLKSGFKGAKIGSLGSINAIFLGMELIQAIGVNPLESTNNDSKSPEHSNLSKKGPKVLENQSHLTTPKKSKLPPLIQSNGPSQSSSNLKPELVAKNHNKVPFFSKTKEKSNPFKTTQSHNFHNPEECKTFIDEVERIIEKNEVPNSPKKKEGLSRIGAKDLDILMDSLKDTLSLNYSFWDQLEPMNNKEVKLFVSKLSPIKEKEKNSSSSLDYLWRRFNGFESEPSKREKKGEKFALILQCLSDSQLQAAFESPDFLNLFNQEVYLDTAANTFNRNQLKGFASSCKNHETLNSIIKKLKPDPSLLGKLVSVMPYGSEVVRIALIDQLSHLFYPVSFKVELTKLADHYISMNEQTAENSPDNTERNEGSPLQRHNL